MTIKNDLSHDTSRKKSYNPLISREKTLDPPDFQGKNHRTPPTVNLVPPVHISNELSLSLIQQLLVTPTRTGFCSIKDQGGEGAKDIDVIIF